MFLSAGDNFYILSHFYTNNDDFSIKIHKFEGKISKKFDLRPIIYLYIKNYPSANYIFVPTHTVILILFIIFYLTLPHFYWIYQHYE